MAKRKDGKSSRPADKEKARLKAIYAKYRADFSSADLQKYTEVEEGIPFESIVAQIDELHRKSKRKRA